MFKHESDSTEDNETTHLADVRNVNKGLQCQGPWTVCVSYLIRASSKLFADKGKKKVTSKLNSSFCILLCMRWPLYLHKAQRFQSSVFAYREKHVKSYLAGRKEVEKAEDIPSSSHFFLQRGKKKKKKEPYWYICIHQPLARKGKKKYSLICSTNT